MKIEVRRALLLIAMMFGVTSSFAQKHAPATSSAKEEEVLLRLTAEPMAGSVGEIPVTLRRVDKPGPPIELIATPGAVDAALIPAGVYELVSETAVEINGQEFQWQMRIPVFDHITRIRLSVANAIALNNVTPPENASSQRASGTETVKTTKPQDSLVEVELKLDPVVGTGQGRASTPIELRRLDRPQAPINSKIQDGVARLQVTPGRYEIVTLQPINIGNREYYWDMEAPLTEPVNRVELPEWQALVVSRDNLDVQQKPERSAGAQTSKKLEEPPASSADPEEVAIRKVLDTWVRSLRDRNLDLHLACYAPKMDRYFLKTNVNADEVRRDKERFLRRFATLKKLEISDVDIHRSGDVAEANFRKSWDFEGVKSSRGEVASRLLLAKISGRWLITLERERYLDQDTRRASLR